MTKRMFSKPRKRRVSAGKSVAIEDVSAPIVDRNTGYLERWTFIRDKVQDALKTILRNPKYDWTREPSETISERAESLVLTMISYAEGEKDENHVKDAYKEYVRCYTV